MKSLTLFVYLIATVIVVYTGQCHCTTFADLVSHVARGDRQQCYESANLTEAELFNKEEMKSGAYKNPENAERARKNGCYASCMLQNAGMIVDSVIQTEKLKGKQAHRPELQAQINAIVDRCVEQVKTIADLCDKSVELIVCIWKDFLH